MKWMKPVMIMMVVMLLLSACAISNQKVVKEERSVKAKETAKGETEEKTTLTNVPVMVGAHPRCCVGINVKRADLQTNPDLFIIELELRILLGFQEGITETNIYVGYEDMIPAFNLLTDQGVFNGFLHDSDILREGEPKTFEVIFPEAKGNLLGLSMRRLFEESQIGDGSYRDADKQGSFAYLEDVTDEMMKRIGRQMFDKVTSIELAKTEVEAGAILDSIFDRNYPPEIYGLLLNEITYGDYSDYKINFKNEIVEFNDMEAFIRYGADVEISLYGQNGEVARTKGFSVSSQIGISTDTGDYYYSGLDYDYLTGTD